MNLSDVNALIINCQKCPRLVAWRQQVGLIKRKAFKEQEYWSKPVPGFGDPQARVFVVGLAPGAHGSNRTGRQFTGDASGNFLFPALFRAGFASQPMSNSRNDGLRLIDIYISAVCRCVPPGNKPTVEEIRNCGKYLDEEIKIVQPKIFVALGRIAHEALFHILFKEHGNTISARLSRIKFTHNSIFQMADGKYLVTSFHPSRQNTQTGRLTAPMFDAVWESIRKLLVD